MEEVCSEEEAKMEGEEEKVCSEKEEAEMEGEEEETCHTQFFFISIIL